MINEVSAKFIVSSWNFNNLRRLRRNLSRSHRNTELQINKTLQTNKDSSSRMKNEKSERESKVPVIKREFLVKNFGEIKTHAFKKFRLQRH